MSLADILKSDGEPLQLTYGIVGTVSPMTVTVPPSTVAVPCSALQHVAVSTGAKVAILQQGADRVIVGSTETVGPAWITPTFQNSWVGFAGISVAYRKIGDIVYVRGAANGTAGALATAVFTLPAGYRPTIQLDFAQVMGANTIGWSSVFASGVVTANFGNKDFCAMNMVFSISA